MTEKRPVQANDLYRLRLVTDAQISPDGSQVAYVVKTVDEEKNDYPSNIYVVDRDGTARQFTSGNKDSAPRWSPDGKWLAFLSGRKEKAQIYLISTRGGEAFPLTERKFGAGVPEWSPDSTRIAFTAAVPLNPEDDKDDEGEKKGPAKTKVVARASYKNDGQGFIGDRRSHVFVVTLEGHALTQITEGDFNNSTVAWSPDGKHLAFGTDRSERWDVSVYNDIYVAPAEGGEERKVTSGGSYSHPVFSPDGSRIAFVGSDNPEKQAPARLYSINRDGTEQRLESPNFDGSIGYDVIGDIVSAGSDNNLYWRSDGLYFLGTERGVSNVYCTNGQANPVTTGRRAMTGFSMADDGTIAFAAATITKPVEIYLWENGEARELTHENAAFLADIDIQEPERFSFAGANGEESEGWLLKPIGHATGKHPLIVYIHGGPVASYGETPFFEYQVLASNGYGVFFPNIHGSSTYGRDYQTSILADWGNMDYQDVMAGTEVVAARDWVDSNRLGIIGGSYGGYMTNWVMGHNDRFKTGVTERCVSNWLSFMGSSDHGWAWNRTLGAYPEEDVQKLWDMSPIKYMGNVTGPMMVIHYERDDRCPIEQGEQVFNMLRRHGVETKFVIYPEESHGMSRGGKPSRRVERMGIITDWFNSHL